MASKELTKTREDLNLEINPARVTLISTLPYILREEKPGMFPAIYEVNAAPERGKLGITHIGNGYHLELVPYGDSKTPQRRIDIVAERIAEGLIFDYTAACLGVSFEPNDEGILRKPGMFWVSGVLSANEVAIRFAKEVETAQNQTAAWFWSLVTLADDDWGKYKQHKMITNIQRIAAKHLNLKREWSIDAVELVNNVCPACGESVNPGAAICKNCKAIVDPEKYKTLTFAEVK